MRASPYIARFFRRPFHYIKEAYAAVGTKELVLINIFVCAVFLLPNAINLDGYAVSEDEAALPLNSHAAAVKAAGTPPPLETPREQPVLKSSSSSSPSTSNTNASGVNQKTNLPLSVISNSEFSRAEGEENVKLHSLWSTHHTGFPPKALSIEQAKLCDTKLQITLKNGFRCAKDPTCQKCHIPGEVKKSKELMKIWNSDAEVESRKAVFGRLHANRQEDVIVMGINKGMLHLWLNWVCGCEDIGIDVKRSTLMVPTDKETYDFIKKLGYYAIKPSWTEKFNVDPVYDGKAGRRGHRWVNDVLLYTCLDLVANGFDVIAQDVDIVWAHDPRPYLREAAKGRDILTSLAPRWDGMGPANTGFMYLKSTFRTKIFLETAMNMSPIKGKSDQMLVNVLLRHQVFRQVHFEILPISLFTLMNKQNWPKHRKTALVIHAVSIRKTQRLRADKLLYFNTSCAHYDEKLDPCVDDTEGCIL